MACPDRSSAHGAVLATSSQHTSQLQAITNIFLAGVAVSSFTHNISNIYTLTHIPQSHTHSLLVDWVVIPTIQSCYNGIATMHAYAC